MRVAEAELLFVPGLGNSGPDHWQTRWQERLSTARRVQQADWHRPSLPEWTGRIVEAVTSAAKPVVLLGHSVGVIAIAHAAASFGEGRVRGAFLVAPPAQAWLREAPVIDSSFAELPRGPLPFPSIMVASRNDLYSDYRQSEELALDWGANLIDAGEAGHINADSGHGPWPEGLMRFAAFMAKLTA